MVRHVLKMQPSDDPRKALTWLPMSRRSVGRPRTTWHRMAEKSEKERSEELGWKSLEEARQVVVNRVE